MQCYNNDDDDDYDDDGHFDVTESFFSPFNASRKVMLELMKEWMEGWKEGRKLLASNFPLDSYKKG